VGRCCWYVKGFDFNPNSVTSDADDGGGYVETIITNSDFTLSFEGEVRKKDKLDQYGVGKFIKYFADELKASASLVSGCAWTTAR
jgi:hypothetical protein